MTECDWASHVEARKMSLLTCLPTIMEHKVAVRKKERRDAIAPRPAEDTKLNDDEMAKMRASFTAKTEVKLSTLPRAGRGLFACERIEAKQNIVEYKGEIITFAEAKARRLRGKASHIRSIIPMSLCVDGVREDMGGAMANDPKKQSMINAELVSFHSTLNVFRCNPKHSLSYLRALRMILPGEEIFVDYGRDYDWLA